MKINILYKIFTYLLQFLFLPVSIYSTLHFDFFDLDFFNRKKIIKLENQIEELKKLNSIQNKELENNTVILKNNYIISDDIKKYLFYTGALLTTIVGLYILYNFFNNNNGEALKILAEQGAQNSTAIVENIKSQNQLSNDVNKQIGDNIITTIKNINKETILALTDVAETININSNNQNTESFGGVLSIVNENITNLNNGFNEQLTKIINYVYENVAQKLNRIDSNINRVVELSNSIVDNMNNNLTPKSVESVPTNWGTGKILGSSISETSVIVEPPVVTTVSSNFNLNPSDLEFELDN